MIHLYGVLSHSLKISVEIILSQMHRCNLLCREKSGWLWGGNFLSHVLDALSKACVPLTPGILFGLYVKNVSVSVANAICRLLIIERSLKVLPE